MPKQDIAARYRGCRLAVGVAHPIENYVDEGGVASEGFADPDPDVGVPLRGAFDLCGDVFGGVATGPEEERMYDDVGRAFSDAGFDPFADAGIGDFQMCDFDDGFCCAFANLIGDIFE